MKKVSLILTTYNSAENLSRTLESIEQQDYPNIEVNIKDGGSTDDTLSIIDAYAKSSRNKVNWTTGPDKGIYDAMNQGYALSTGEIIVFFNDLFVKTDAVSIMAQQLETHPECSGAHADLIYATDEKIIRYWKMGPQKSIRKGWMPGHPTLFLRREVYETYGLYDTKYRCSADYEFMVRMLKDGKVKLVYVPQILVRMYYGGTSTNSSGAYMTSIKEAHMALRNNNVKGAWWIVLLRTLRTVPQFFQRGKMPKIG